MVWDNVVHKDRELLRPAFLAELQRGHLTAAWPDAPVSFWVNFEIWLATLLIRMSKRIWQTSLKKANLRCIEHLILVQIYK